MEEQNKECIIAVAQMNSNEIVERNLESLARLAKQAFEQNVNLLITPECFSYLGPEEGKLEIAEKLPEGGSILQFCRELAMQYRFDLLLGGFWEASSEKDKVYNTSIYLNEKGDIQAIYRKIHLFDVTLPNGDEIKESRTCLAGNKIVTTQAPFGVLGLSICYDLRFPELYRQLVDLGALGLAIPAAFTKVTGEAHWKTLIRARAIESQCYVFAAAQSGHHFANRYSYGHSMIVNPWGDIISSCDDELEHLLTAKMNVEELIKVRKNLPSLEHRRKDIIS